MQVKYVNIYDLKPYENNPRKNNKAVDQVIKSIEAYGFKNPILIDENNVIIAGHTRYKASQQMGLAQVPTIMITDLTEEQKKGYRIADNRTSEFAEWDMDLLKVELDGLDQFTGFDIEDFNLLEDKEIIEDEIPEIQEKIITKLGDLYEIGEHRLLCGDSTKEDSYIILMNNDIANMVITDPPYNVDYKSIRSKNPLKIKNDSMKNDEFYQFLYDFYISLKTVVKKGSAIYIWHSTSQIINFAKAMVDAGWLLKQQLIWVKNIMVLGRQDYHWKHEPCLYGWLDGDSHNWYSDRKQSTVIEFDKPNKSKEHPTMKPVGLFSYQIKNSSKINDIIIDPFGGSGTTMVASEQLKRKSRLIELDPKYCDVIIRRMINLDPNITIKRNGIECKQEFL